MTLERHLFVHLQETVLSGAKGGTGLKGLRVRCPGSSTVQTSGRSYRASMEERPEKTDRSFWTEEETIRLLRSVVSCGRIYTGLLGILVYLLFTVVTTGCIFFTNLIVDIIGSCIQFRCWRSMERVTDQ